MPWARNWFVHAPLNGRTGMYAVGSMLQASNNFTLLGYLDGLDGPALERTLGFHPGRLAAGFSVACLAESEWLLPRDIDLKASTRWPAGGLRVPGSPSVRELESLLAERGQDVDSLKTKVCAFFARRGRNTPAKVIPVTLHEDGMQYPAAEAIAPGVRSGVPQFHLNVPKCFVVVRVG